MSPDSVALPGMDQTRDSPLGDPHMKSPHNGYHESKSPFPFHEEHRSPFQDDFHPHLAYKFEDRITGESLIPKGDPMEARLQEILRWGLLLFCCYFLLFLIEFVIIVFIFYSVKLFSIDDSCNMEKYLVFSTLFIY